MVSRRKILSRSRDDLNLDQTFNPQEEEEDIWYQKDKLYKEHIQEVLDKWTQIDDEIWAKVIVFERNRRVAKAYARAPVLTINGSDDGFDGMRIGLCGFDNPMRDQKTDEFKRHIGQGVKIKMDDAGNILIRRYAKSNVYIKSTANNANEETSIGADILKLPNQALESEKIVKLFDMKKFQSNVNRELRRAYPDRRRLETQCLSAVAFVKSENDILECPIWVLIVNVVAMDMLKSKLPPAQRPMVDIKNRPRIPIPDEDPYSVAGNGSGGSSGSSGFGAGSSSNNVSNGHPQSNGSSAGAGSTNGSNGLHMNNGHVAATREQLLLQTQQLAYKRSEKPPKLPPRDNIYSHDIIPKPDYDDVDLESRIKLARGKSDKGKDNKKYDDPYYCGLRARVPNFVKSSKPPTAKELKEKDYAPLNNINANGHHNGNSGMNTLSQKKTSMIHHGTMHMHHPHHAMIHHTPGITPHHHLHQHPHQHHHHPQSQLWQTPRNFENSLGIYDYRPVAQAPFTKTTTTLLASRSLPPPNSLITGLNHTNFYENDDDSNDRHAYDIRNSTRLGRHARYHQQQQQQQQQHQRHQGMHRLHHNTRRPHSSVRPHSQTNRREERIYYDDLVKAKRLARLDQRRDQYSSMEFCNCVSCHALAPLFGAPAPSRPPRSLSQQMLIEHRRLSGAGIPDNFGRTTVKWCSESDLSEFGRTGQRYQQRNQQQLNDRFDMEPLYDFDSTIYDQTNQTNELLDADLNMDEKFDMNYFRMQRRSSCQRKLLEAASQRMTSVEPHSFEVLRPAAAHVSKDVNFAHKMRHRQRLPEPLSLSTHEMENDITNSILTKEAPFSLLQKQGRSLSIESFFEQPNEEGSLYMYGGRKRITKTPSLNTNLYESTTKTTTAIPTTTATTKTLTTTQLDKDLTKVLERTKKQMTQLSNKINDRYKNNSNNNNDNNNNKNNSNMHTNKTTINDNNKNANKSISKETKQKNKNNVAKTTITKPPLPPPCWRNNNIINKKKHQQLDHNNNKNNNKGNGNGNGNGNISLAIAKKIENLQQKQQKDLNNADLQKQNELRLKNQSICKNTKNNNNKNSNSNNNNNKTIENTLKERKNSPTQTTTPAQHTQRQSRPTSRVDISDMESIYGYLKPRKPRSLSLKKIQIYDY